MSNDHQDGQLDQSQNESHDPSEDHSDASLVPNDQDMSRDMISFGPQAEKAADATKMIAPSSKDIVLQRLTPHSSWNSLNDASSDESSSPDIKMDAPVPPAAAAKHSLPMAAIVAIAAIVGAAGGSAATFGVGHFMSGTTDIAEQSRTIESLIAKANADIASVKSAATANSTKLAKLSDTVEKLRAPESTGAIAPPVPAQPARLPVVEGWSLREASEGRATVLGNDGIYEIYPGNPLPGVGRVDAIRRQDGRWVVVTSRGLIVSR